jgi:hypothetical protein
LWFNPKPSQQSTASLSCDPIESLLNNPQLYFLVIHSKAFSTIHSFNFLWSNPIHRFMVHISFQSTASLLFDSNQNLSHQSASRFIFLFAFLNNPQLHGSASLSFDSNRNLSQYNPQLHDSYFSLIFLNNISQRSFSIIN